MAASVAIRKFASSWCRAGANFRISSHTSRPYESSGASLDLKFAPNVTRSSGELQIQHTSGR